MTPLKVTFRVSGGFVPPPYPFHLDALLAYAQTYDSLDDIGQGGDVGQLRALAANMPIRRFEQGGDWCYMASALTVDHAVLNDSRFYTQKISEEDYAARVDARQILHGKRHHPGVILERYQFPLKTAGGIHRNMLGFYPVQRGAKDGDAMLDLVAWCVAEQWWVEDRLSGGRITHLGQRRRNGHGKIESISIVEDKAAMDKWQMRVRPWKLGEDDVEILAACQPPYWAPENRRLAFCPKSL